MTAVTSESPLQLSLSRLTPALGATVAGVDLSAQPGAPLVNAIRRALDDHLVLFFENQLLTPRQQRDFAAFGALYVHPLYPGADGIPEIMVLEYGEERKGHNNVWHTDVTYIETPPQASVLYAEEIPASGGDTLWANAYLAFESLSQPLQRFLEGLHAVHDFSKAFGRTRFSQYGIGERADRAYGENPPVTHPVVRTNPQTGRKALFVNRTFTSHIEGVSAAESDALLRLLFEHLAQSEFQVRWSWKPGTVAFWDNRWTQHYAISDYFPQRRRMRRATILGDRVV